MSQEQKPYIGGQAVIEGVMMRAPCAVSIACRKPDGSVIIEDGPVPKSLRSKIWKLPLLRGIAMLGESMGLGFYAITFSAKQQEELGEEEAPSSGWMIAVSVLIAISIFVLLPQVLARFSGGFFGAEMKTSDPLYQVAIGGFKLFIFTAYLLLLSRTKDAQRLFQYHGAEHKTINAYEADQDLTVENVRQASRLHPRCGTTFLLVVVAVSILVGIAIAPLVVPAALDGKWQGEILLFLARVACLPVIASISYEFQRFTARYCTTGPLRFLVYPGFLFQRITTREPEDDQIEIAIVAFRAAEKRSATAPEATDKTERGFADFSDFDAAMSRPV